MNLIKKGDLLRIYEKNLSKRDKTEMSVLLDYSSAGSLKRALKNGKDSYLDSEETQIVNEFFKGRGGFAEQLSIANKKSEKYDFETKETKDLLEVIKSTLPRIQGISDTEYLNKLKESLEVAISTIDTQFKINNLR